MPQCKAVKGGKKMAALPDKDLQAIYGDEWVAVKERIKKIPRFPWLASLFGLFGGKKS